MLTRKFSLGKIFDIYTTISMKLSFLWRKFPPRNVILFGFGNEKFPLVQGSRFLRPVSRVFSVLARSVQVCCNHRNRSTQCPYGIEAPHRRAAPRPPARAWPAPVNSNPMQMVEVEHHIHLILYMRIYRRIPFSSQGTRGGAGPAASLEGYNIIFRAAGGRGGGGAGRERGPRNNAKGKEK